MPLTLTQSPSTLRVDLTSQAFKRDPLPTLARLREAGPVARVRVPLFGHVWMATTYDAVNDVLRDHRRFLQNPTTAGHRGMGWLLRLLPGNIQPLRAQMLIRDEPDHRRLRSLVEQAFQRRQIESLRPRLEALADAALDQFAAAAQSSAAGADLITHFARPFPLSVICELLGLPQADRPKFTRWASGFSSANSIPGILWGLRRLGKLLRYVRDEIQRQSMHPRGGLLSALIQVEEAGDRLNEDELLAMVFLLLLAGHETTLHQITGSVWLLLHHQARLHELRRDWSIVDTAVQELLRYFSFAQVAKPRYAGVDLELHGQVIRKSQMLLVSLAAANADPAEFPEPEQLDLRRAPNRHVAFGAGIHYCLGAQLASLETEIALRKLFTRFPQLRLAIPDEQLRFSGRFGTRGLLSLPLHG